MALTVATYNIHSAVGIDRKFAPERIGVVLQEINADVFALQEVPLGGGKRHDVLEDLEKATGMTSVRGPTLECPDGDFGNAVLCKCQVVAVRNIDLSFDDTCEPRGALDADLNFQGHLLRIVATHLGLRPAERRYQIRRLLEVFDTDEMPVLLMGDINEWFVWGRPLRWLRSRFQKVPAPPTFPSFSPIFSLDRIWIRPRQRLIHVRVHRSRTARVASDHLPLVAQIGDHVGSNDNPPFSKKSPAAENSSHGPP